MNFKHHIIALASSTLLATGLAHAADNMAPPAPMVKSTAPIARTSSANTDREMLEQKLKAGTSRADYEKILVDNGYRIAAINEDKKDYVEYEVVKGRSTYEVQFDFKNGAPRASEVDVAPNLWRADATKKMMKDPKYQHTGPIVADTKGRYSDSNYKKSWGDEKERLEKSLPLNLKAADYKAKLEGMGYKVTSVNDRDKDHVEYEIAKGETSYEVQIDLDAKTGRAKDIDVSSNLWEAPATDRATDKSS